jgi:hypothetical protein
MKRNNATTNADDTQTQTAEPTQTQTVKVGGRPSLPSKLEILATLAETVRTVIGKDTELTSYADGSTVCVGIGIPLAEAMANPSGFIASLQDWQGKFSPHGLTVGIPDAGTVSNRHCFLIVPSDSKRWAYRQTADSSDGTVRKVKFGRFLLAVSEYTRQLLESDDELEFLQGFRQKIGALDDAKQFADIEAMHRYDALRAIADDADDADDADAMAEGTN